MFRELVAQIVDHVLGLGVLHRDLGLVAAAAAAGGGGGGDGKRRPWWCMAHVRAAESSALSPASLSAATIYLLSNLIPTNEGLAPAEDTSLVICLKGANFAMPVPL